MNPITQVERAARIANRFARRPRAPLPGENVCPACGPIQFNVSSMYCRRHVAEFRDAANRLKEVKRT